MTVGEIIKSARKESGFTQQEAADLLKVHKRSVEQWERDERKPKKDPEYIAECLRACGILTSEGRQQVIDGEWTMDDVLIQYKLNQAQKASKWGKFPGTYEANWNRIPKDFIEVLTADQLGRLVDIIKDAYDDGKRSNIK